jgi:ABC-type antimicrobial peptide transport system permease subunit
MAICGTLVLGSLMEVWRQQPGYDPANTVFLDLRARTRGDMAVNHEILVTLRGVPGVVAAGGSNNWFMSRAFNGSSFDRPSGAGVIPGHGIQDEGIMPGFFEAAGLPLLKGRWPTAAELLGAEGVVVVNDNTAKAYWPGRDPIGQQLMRRGRPFSVIGVVPNVRQLALDIESDGIIYFPLAASNYPVLQTVFVRFADGVRPDLPRLIERLQSPRFSSYAVRRALTMSGALGESDRNRKFHTLVFAAFGIAAVAIVGAGVLGLVAMVTSRRTRELGVRIALGAHPAMIVRLVVRQEFAAVIAGGAAGGMVSWWAVRFVEAYLFKTSTHDPRLWLISALVLLTVTLAGAAVPAIRASRIDPVRALRAE